MHPPTPDELHQDQYEQRQANAMMRIRPAALRSDGKICNGKSRGDEQHGQDLQPYVIAKACAAPKKSFGNDGYRNKEEEDDGGEDGVGADERVVLGDGGETVRHA